MPTAVESTGSKLMGAAKDIKATFKGLTGVFKHLMEEHGKVSALLKRVKASSEESVRAELYPTIRKELLAHEKGEVTAVYPVLAQFAETTGIAAEHAEEANELQAAIAAVDALAFSDPNWGPTFERLVALVDAHVKEEEDEYFPKAQDVIGEDQAKALLPRFEQAKHR
jgi:hemerythrin superfamily protein